jgi:hypothetical protein
VSYQFYKILHLVGIMLLFLSLGGFSGLAAAGGHAPRGGLRRLSMIGHGLALLFLLVAGFGLLARLGLVSGMPAWAWLKLGIWVVLGGAVVTLRRFPGAAAWQWLVIIVLGGCAAALAIYKPW